MIGFIIYEGVELIYYTGKLTYNISKSLYNWSFSNKNIKDNDNITDEILEDCNIKDNDNDKEKIEKLVKINKILFIKLKELENKIINNK